MCILQVGLHDMFCNISGGDSIRILRIRKRLAVFVKRLVP